MFYTSASRRTIYVTAGHMRSTRDIYESITPPLRAHSELRGFTSFVEADARMKIYNQQ